MYQKFLVATLMLFAGVIALNFESDINAKFVECFGQYPFGLPVSIVVSTAEVVLFLSVPYFLWHFSRIAGRPMSEIFAEADMKRSLLICAGGFTYLIAIIASWIAYTASRGI